MKKAIVLLAVLLVSVFSHAEEEKTESPKKLKVGLLCVATGKYCDLGVKMIETARQYFLPNHDRTFFIFTDGNVPEAKDIVRIEQKKMGWPNDSMKRFHVYHSHKDLFKDFDYLYTIDADMVFLSEVGDEIIGDLMATRHWGYLDKPGTYCGNKKSRAYVTRSKRANYCCGAFYGGTRENVLAMIETNMRDVDVDLQKNIIPKWHDESYINHYFIDHPPTVLMSPSYCFPQGWDLPFEPKLITIFSKSSELRL